jgi:hypothetical protein
MQYRRLKEKESELGRLTATLVEEEVRYREEREQLKRDFANLKKGRAGIRCIDQDLDAGVCQSNARRSELGRKNRKERRSK